MIISATQIRIKSIIGLFRFIPKVRNIQMQLTNVEGLIFQNLKVFVRLQVGKIKKRWRLSVIMGITLML